MKITILLFLCILLYAKCQNLTCPFTCPSNFSTANTFPCLNDTQEQVKCLFLHEQHIWITIAFVETFRIIFITGSMPLAFSLIGYTIFNIIWEVLLDMQEGESFDITFALTILGNVIIGVIVLIILEKAGLIDITKVGDYMLEKVIHVESKKIARTFIRKVKTKKIRPISKEGTGAIVAIWLILPISYAILIPTLTLISSAWWTYLIIGFFYWFRCIGCCIRWY